MEEFVGIQQRADTANPYYKIPYIFFFFPEFFLGVGSLVFSPKSQRIWASLARLASVLSSQNLHTISSQIWNTFPFIASR